MTATAPIPRLPDLGSAIDHFETRVLSVPLDPIIITRHYRIETIEMVVLRARDADGVIGLSMLWCFGLPQTRVLLAAIEYLTDHLLGAADRLGHGDGWPSMDALLQDLQREINFLGFKGVSVFAYSAVEMALVDLACRRAGVSVGAALGRRRSEIPVYWSGLFSNQTLPELLDEVDRKLAEGFRAMKVRTGGRPLNDDLARVTAVLDRLPEGTRLMIDAVQSWSVDEALAAVDRLADLPITWIEDPLVHHDYRGLAQVTSRSTIPIATGENEYLRHGFDHLLDCGPSYLLADLERVGGVHEWLAVADAARSRHVVLTPHVYPHIALQLCSALDQDENWIEYIGWWDPLHAEPLRIVDGALVVPETVGLGLDPDPAALDRYALGTWTRI